MASDDLYQISHKKLRRLMQEDLEKARLQGWLEGQEKELRKIQRDLRYQQYVGEEGKNILESNAQAIQWWINLTRGRVGDCQAAINQLQQEIKVNSYLWVATFEELHYAHAMLADGGGHVRISGPPEIVANARPQLNPPLPSSRSFEDAAGPSGQNQ